VSRNLIDLSVSMASHHRSDNPILSSFVKWRLLWLGFAAQKCCSKCLWYLQMKITPAGIFRKISAMQLSTGDDKRIHFETRFRIYTEF
jgi:hypothetical protein